MSLQFGLQMPPPPSPDAAYVSPGGHGSIGPVIAVLVVIAVLGVLAGIVGRLCSGRTVMGYGNYDLEGWMDRKCSSCIGGRLEEPPTRPLEAVVVAMPQAANGTAPAASMAA